MLPALRKTNDNFLSNLFNDNFLSDTITNFFDSAWKRDKDGNEVFEVEVPGFNKDNLSVELKDGILTIEGKTDIRRIFKRYTIGNIQDVKASIADGILSLTIIEPEAKTVKKIELTS